MDNTVEAVTFMATDVTNVCPVYSYTFPDFVPFMVTKNSVFVSQKQTTTLFSSSLRYSMEPNVFFSTDFHRIIFGLSVGNTTSISRTTLEYFMTIVRNMLLSFSLSFPAKNKRSTNRRGDCLRSSVLTATLKNYLKLPHKKLC
jgi:hypothetical protein